MADEQPCTSKQAIKKESEHIPSGEDQNNGSGSDHKSHTNSKLSYPTSMSSYSIGSEVMIADMGLEMPKPALKKEESKDNKGIERKKKRKRQSGRVNKRRRPLKRQARRDPKRKPRNIGEKRRLSSGTRSPCCRRCGHRCCRRRYEHNARAYPRRKQNRTRTKTAIKSVVRKNSGAAAVQAGSRCEMLSPLFIKSNCTPVDEEYKSEMYSEITPEMIHQAVRDLSMWRQEVTTQSILEYLKSHYPVDSDDNALLQELIEKLRIAALVGIVTQLSNDSWWIPTKLQQRSLRKTHVTLFWQAYVDTMRPVTANYS